MPPPRRSHYSRQRQEKPANIHSRPPKAYRPIPSPPTATASFAASTDWLNEGLPSQRIAELVCQIANSNIRPSARKSCFNSLVKGQEKVSFRNRDRDLPRTSPRNNDLATPTSTGGIMHASPIHYDFPYHSYASNMSSPKSAFEHFTVDATYPIPCRQRKHGHALQHD
jgi:hypothetical protein